MKKILPYLLGGLLLLLLFSLLTGGSNRNFDHRITLNKKDKIPYGTFIAYENLHYLFPRAKLFTNKKESGYWEKTVAEYDPRSRVMIIICKEFNATDDELANLFHFVSIGNDVLISAYDLSNDAQRFFNLDLSYADAGFPLFDDFAAFDTLSLELIHPPFSKERDTYAYPGRKYNSWFNRFDSSTTYLLGTSEQGKPSFIRLRAGEGSFFIHTAPLAFSNYFLLHKQNIGYYNQLLSALNTEATSVIWDEYYLKKPQQSREYNLSPLRVLMDQPAFRMAFLTAIAGLIVYILLGIKRNQRMIPVITSPGNESLDFIKTIGRLYFQKKDNKNLCQKMSVHFTEHVYRRFNIPSGNMDDHFISRLSQKSGCSMDTIQQIRDYIHVIQEAPAVNDRQVFEFYHLLDRFYKTT